jgi:hypothetical protein
LFGSSYPTVAAINVSLERVMVFRVIMPCSTVEVHWHFRGAYHPHLQSWAGGMQSVNNPGDCTVHSYHCENLKSKSVSLVEMHGLFAFCCMWYFVRLWCVLWPLAIVL